MRSEAIIVAILLVGSALPLASARHLSAGYEGSVGVSPQEAPDDPTVLGDAPPFEGEQVADDDDSAIDPYDRGIRTDCVDPEGELSPEDDAAAVAGDGSSDLTRSAQADGLCGELVYHADEPALRRQSPPDQHYPAAGEVSQLDVQITNYAGTFLEDWSLDQPGGDIAWDAIHTVGSTGPLALTDDPDRADREEASDRDQLYVVNAEYPTAARLVQENTGLWEMNGWKPSNPQQSFVGFLYDEDGDPISEEEIQGLIDSSLGLSSEARPRVCGFTPELDFAATATIGPCEISLHYLEPGDGEPNFRDGYRNACESPTYVCSVTSGGAWYGRIQCPITCGPISSDTEYRTWHWVAAPTLNQDCDAREPGFVFEPPQGASMPYLAHDLDVYSPRASVAEEGRSVPTVEDWADEFAGNPVGEALDTLPGLPSLAEAVSPVSKQDRVEPNARPAGALAETSQHLSDPVLDRELRPCDALSVDEQPATDDDPGTVDPWVDVVDGTAEIGTNSQRSGTGQEALLPFVEGSGVGADPVVDVANFGLGILGSEAGDDLGLYANQDTAQDSSNRGGPATVWTQGKVGMFADKNDDGEYDQVFFGDKYQNPITAGAWPMIWDLWVTEESGQTVIDNAAGCTVTGGDSIGDIAEGAHFGPHTGLAQAIYLQEPTAFFDPITRQATVFEGGNNIYVLGSQSVHELWTSTLDDSQNELDTEIDAAVSDLRDFADDRNPNQPTPQIHQPGELLGRSTDFQNQCGEPTGGFTSGLSFLHDCSVDCEGDTVATVYHFEVTSGDGSLGDSASRVPPFAPQGDVFHGFGTGQTWVDVDPLDNDPDRNRDASSAPPTADE